MKTQVQSIEVPQGNKPWKATLSDGRAYATFDPGLPLGLTVGMWIDATTHTEQRESGGRTYENLYIDGWQVIDTPAAGEVPATPAPTDWEAKDRRIALESAASSAAQVMQALAISSPSLVSSETFKTLYRVIYRDIQTAGAGEPFEELKPPSRPKPNDSAEADVMRL